MDRTGGTRGLFITESLAGKVRGSEVIIFPSCLPDPSSQLEGDILQGRAVWRSGTGPRPHPAGRGGPTGRAFSPEVLGVMGVSEGPPQPCPKLPSWGKALTH